VVKFPLTTLLGLLREFVTKALERGFVNEPVRLFPMILLLKLLVLPPVVPPVKGLVLYLLTLPTPKLVLKLLLGVTLGPKVVMLLLFKLFPLGLKTFLIGLILSFNPLKVSSIFLSTFLFQLSR
jgi:hypothetical protein